MADIVDDANKNEDKVLKIRLDNREKFTKWDGLPRECSECSELIDPRRLKSINATICVACASLDEMKR